MQSKNLASQSYPRSALVSMGKTSPRHRPRRACFVERQTRNLTVQEPRDDPGPPQPSQHHTTTPCPCRHDPPTFLHPTSMGQLLVINEPSISPRQSLTRATLSFLGIATRRQPRPSANALRIGMQVPAVAGEWWILWVPTILPRLPRGPHQRACDFLRDVFQPEAAPDAFGQKPHCPVPRTPRQPSPALRTCSLTIASAGGDPRLGRRKRGRKNSTIAPLDHRFYYKTAGICCKTAICTSQAPTCAALEQLMMRTNCARSISR